MATVFMKWLERSPEDYDRGIQLLTLGRLQGVYEQIVDNYVDVEGLRVLELGCGTGTLTCLLAERGAEVTAIDNSEIMLAEARAKLEASGVADRASFILMDAATMDQHFGSEAFDLIVATLFFSELPPRHQRFVLESCRGMLAPGGRFLIADEVIPRRPLAAALFHLLRLPLVFLTWLLTRTTTHPLREVEDELVAAGYAVRQVASHLGGMLTLYEMQPMPDFSAVTSLPASVSGRLRHVVSLRTILIDIWALFFRIIPPYPKKEPGLYAVGHPGKDAPVLVTGNFDVTVRRVAKAIDGRLDAWLLVVDSAGINVWCASGGHYMTAQKVIAAVNAAHLDQVVRHRALILPQLCANGVDGWQLREATGWGVHWGPIRAEDISAYLNSGRKKDDRMRWVKFPLKDRLEMVTVTMGFYSLLILVPVLIFWRQLFLPVTFSLLGLSYFYAVVHPWLPGRDGLMKSVPLASLALIGLLAYSYFWHPFEFPRQLFNWAIGLIGLAVFTGAELQGMSPLMRGEQANWRWEALIGVVLILIVWLLPLAAGWS